MDTRLNYQGSAVAMKFAKYLDVGGQGRVGFGPADRDADTWWRSGPARSTAAPTAPTCTPRTPRRRGQPRCRLNLVATWREATVFRPRPSEPPWKLAEQGTRIADAAGGVTDEAWANAAKHYDEEQLAALVALIAGIDAWNRMNVDHASSPAGDLADHHQERTRLGNPSTSDAAPAKPTLVAAMRLGSVRHTAWDRTRAYRCGTAILTGRLQQLGHRLLMRDRRMNARSARALHCGILPGG